MGDLVRVPRGPRDFRKFCRSLGSRAGLGHPNPDWARSAKGESARLRGFEGIGGLVRLSSTYKSGLGFFVSPLGAKLSK